MTTSRANDDLGIDMEEDSLGMGVVRKEVDLTNDEKQYLLAVERGDIPSTRQYLNLGLQTGLNINCVDPLGRTALLVSIENENIEMIELLLSNNVELGDSLLQAINEENVEAVELLLNHEVATKGEEVSYLEYRHIESHLQKYKVTLYCVTTKNEKEKKTCFIRLLSIPF